MHPGKPPNLFALALYILLFHATAFAINGQSGPPAPPSVDEYVIGPQDVVEIKVWENPDLSGKAVVSLDGFINYYLIGKVKAQGLTPAQLRETITRLLADGYLIDPQVSVEVVEYKSKKVVINGEVANPGTYYLTRRMTVVEAITIAGGQTKDSDREIFVIRKKDSAQEVFAPDAERNKNTGGTDIQIQIDLRAALEGDLSQNILVKNGDYIFVPKAKTFFIMGEVKKPGEYNFEKETTLLKAISLAGGLTDKASMGRAKVIRTVKGKKEEMNLSPNDMLEPGDTVLIPESLF